MSRRARWSVTTAAAVVALSLGAVVQGSGSVAGAAPVNAPSALHGTFTCGTGVSGTFVTNTGNATGTAWNVAHLLFTTGARGIFVPTSLSFTVSEVAVTPTTGDVVATTTFHVPTRAKGNGHPPSTMTCQIAATEGPEPTPTTGLEITITLTGTVVGKIAMNG